MPSGDERTAWLEAQVEQYVALAHASHVHVVSRTTRVAVQPRCPLIAETAAPACAVDAMWMEYGPVRVGRGVEGNRTLLVLLIAAVVMVALVWLLTRTGVI